MSQIKQILDAAQERGARLGLPYSGAVSPVEAYTLWKQVPGACLVDVRSSAEWDLVGMVPDSVRIEFRHYPGMTENPHFMTQLAKQVDPESLVLFLCRSGVRSDETARLAAAAGFSHVYNVLEGFEGDRNADGQRGSTGGWKGRGLPWRHA
ncbi:rhodanese-like domain-containing protein [Paludibacterium yongneupense]|uniref:rhodanese-like domain-containing protein n=1 Tax=Paludibacterium yongneupense TaxID=400061 RepID=UPI0004122980|nr:rhodanese-like domain-containing protein [Paludibacterium yongneupense]